MIKNKMKEILLAGQPAMGVSVMIPSPQIVEMLGKLGFDWVLIDGEHGALSPESMELMIMAAEASGITPIVRPESSAPEAILKALDRGAMGIQVPHVNTAGEVRRVVQAARYHPLGSRGLAAGTRAGNYGFGLSLSDYCNQANRETLVCIQLEEVEALHNLDEILAVEGVDVFFIGPSDLSQSMGYPGRTDAPEVQTVMTAAFTAIASAGKLPGSAGNAQAVKRYLDKGCLYVYTHLTRLLAGGSAEFMRAVGT